MIREMCARVLGSEGYCVTTAGSSEAARHLIQGQSFDLMITDNQMPGVPGLEFVRALRAAQIRLPVLFISGGMSDDVVKHASLQPAEALPKPFFGSQLRAAVKAVLIAAQAYGEVGESAPFQPAGSAPRRMK